MDNNKKINVLSLFDGMSCGQIALERSDIKVNKYFASEIDKYAIKVTQANYPDTIQIGDVSKVNSSGLPNIDILCGGSPCQDLRPGREGLKGTKSKLFYEYYRIFIECKPKYFLLENVGKISADDKKIISDLLGVEPIRINSNLLSAQNRDRYYWTNIPVSVPKDKGINLIDILEPIEDINEKYIYNDRLSQKVKDTFEIKRNYVQYDVSGKGYNSQQDRLYPINNKSPCLPANRGGCKTNILYKIDKKGNIKNYQNKASTLTGGGNSGGNHSDMDILVREGEYRRLTPLEWERLQTVPDFYSNYVSDSQRYKMLGNGWTVDVIAHIFKNMKL